MSPGPSRRRAWFAAHFRSVLKRLASSRLDPLGTIVAVRTSRPVVALTFDDGPDPRTTPRLLELLERHDARATFFVLGKRVEAAPDLVSRMVEAGHALGNHSWDHPSMPTLTGRERRAQIRACREALARFGGEMLFRPPYGHQTTASRVDAALVGHSVVTWNAHAMDWLANDTDWYVERLTKRMRPGSIILLHDALQDEELDLPGTPAHPGSADREPLFQALDRVLARLRDRVRFVTVPEILDAGRPILTYWVSPSTWRPTVPVQRGAGGP